MAEFISFQPSDFFSPKLYTGTGSSNAVTGVGFQPDMVWIKSRSDATDNVLYDAVRGAEQVVYPNTTDGDAAASTGLTAFGADGFTVVSEGNVNGSSRTFASWNWKAGTTSGITTNGSTTITPTAYSFNQTAGISIVQYTGNATSGAKVPHGLGAVPQMIIVKTLGSTNDWNIYHVSLGATEYMKLNDNDSVNTNTNRWNDTTPDSVNFTLGNTATTNASGSLIAYSFAEKKGYSKFGSYVGNNGGANGVFVYTGFRPSLVIQKASSAANGEWLMTDVKRNTYNLANTKLEADTSDIEFTDFGIDILSNGFKTKADGSDQQDSGVTYIYMAFAEFPIVSSNDIPGVAR